MPTIKMHISKDTNFMLNTKLEAAIEKYTKLYKIDIILVRAIIDQESNGKPLAIRVENHLKKAKWYKRLIPEKYRNENFAYCSMGYMQVLYGIARSYGFKGSPHDLLTEDNSIRYGVRHLKELYKRYSNTEDVISAYNQGVPRKHPRKHKLAGKYRNQSYVTSVLKKMEKLTAAIGKESQINNPGGSVATKPPPRRWSWLEELIERVQQSLS